MAIAGFFGTRLVEDILNPNVPEFVIRQDARRVGHYGLAAMALAARPRRRGRAGDTGAAASWLPAPPPGATSDSIPA